MMLLTRIHLWVGVVSLILFVLQGQYMAWGLSLLHNVEDGPRMLYRSAHLYLFLTGAINIALGTNAQTGAGDKLTWITSSIIIAAPALMVFSFFTESLAADLNRPVAALGLQLVFAAMAVRALRALGWGNKPK